jgi:hypothetical protein
MTTSTGVKIPFKEGITGLCEIIIKHQSLYDIYISRRSNAVYNN